MKEKSEIKTEYGAIKPMDLAVGIAYQFGYAVCGFFAAKGQAVGGVAPFGMSFVGGVPRPYIAGAALGAAAGYLLSPSYLTFRYVACVMAIFAIRFLLGPSDKMQKSGLLFLISSAVCGATAVITAGGSVSGVITAVCETVICGGGSFFISRGVSALNDCESGCKTDDLGYLLGSVAIILAGAYSITLGGMSLGRIAAMLFVLLCGYYGGAASGAVCGCALGFSSMLTGQDDTLIIILTFGGMIAGVFSPLGKLVQIAAYLISVFVSISLVGTLSSVMLLIESLLCCSVFLLIPKNAGLFVGKVLTPIPEVLSPAGIKKAVRMRLDFAADALSDVSQTVEQVSKELSKINSPDFDSVLKGIESDACKGCNLRVHCWESRKGETVSAILDMTKAVRQGENMPENFSPEEFRGRCVKLRKFGGAVNARYSAYASKISAENRIDEVRGVVSDQFDGISAMLKDLSEELENDEGFDNAAAQKAAAALNGMDIKTRECSCRVDRYGRQTVEIKINNPKNISINRMQIMQQISVALERDFEPPVITNSGKYAILSLSERARLAVDLGVSQHSCGNSSMCGDAYECFYDGKGRFIMILSDGMGTGGRAAVDSAMASGLMSRLLSAGFGYDCSLKILNSSMLFKSTDESLATVDIAVIDLFSGRTDLLKAGAAPTIVRRSGRTGKAQSTSLPAGILREVGFDKATIRLKKGDILLLLSDGATASGTDWICAELEAFADGTAEELSDKICECAARRREDNHEDDITVLAAIVEKAL